MRPYLEKLIQKQHLTSEESLSALNYAVSDEAHVAEIAAFIALLAAKGETADEVYGIAQGMRANMISVKTPAKVLDIVGTGGDNANSVNISTAAAVLAAAAGCKVAKHGGRSVSSKSGSADVLEELGVHLSLSPQAVTQSIDEAGIAFMFAPNHHPAMKAIAPVRKAIGVRTVFNIMGPLLNPAQAQHMVLGVFSPVVMDIVADTLMLLKVPRAMIVHTEGLDEFSNTGVSQVIEINGDKKVCKRFDAHVLLDMPRASLSDLEGGDAKENAEILRQVLAGKLPGPITDAIVLNAGVGCYVYGLDESIEAGVRRAKDVVRSGKAIETLEKWAEVSQRLA